MQVTLMLSSRNDLVEERRPKKKKKAALSSSSYLNSRESLNAIASQKTSTSTNSAQCTARCEDGVFYVTVAEEIQNTN